MVSSFYAIMDYLTQLGSSQKRMYSRLMRYFNFMGRTIYVVMLGEWEILSFIEDNQSLVDIVDWYSFYREKCTEFVDEMDISSVRTHRSLRDQSEITEFFRVRELFFNDIKSIKNLSKSELDLVLNRYNLVVKKFLVQEEGIIYAD